MVLSSFISYGEYQVFLFKEVSHLYDFLYCLCLHFIKSILTYVIIFIAILLQFLVFFKKVFLLKMFCWRRKENVPVIGTRINLVLSTHPSDSCHAFAHHQVGMVWHLFLSGHQLFQITAFCCPNFQCSGKQLDKVGPLCFWLDLGGIGANYSGQWWL